MSFEIASKERTERQPESSISGSVVAARDLCFAFGEGELRKQILFDVTLNIRPGEIMILTGPSGSGKTTLLTLIGGLRRVRQGQLTVLGHALHAATDDELVQVRSSIGFIFQQHNLLPFLTARRNVELMFQLHPHVSAEEAAKRTEQILDSVGLHDHLDYLPGRMSGGQKQRVAVARALVTSPQLILADEPTAALDSQSGRDVVTLLQELARNQGAPILLVTHDSRILDVADRIVTMEDGRISE